MSLDDTGPGQEAQLPELRHLDDARTLRALAHPVRIALVEALSIGGPMTATEVGEQIGETPTTCSFHLRQLARYGFVEEAGGGKGRSRPWRMTSIGHSIASTHDDPETAIAASTLVRLIRERQLDRYRAWRETQATYPREWRDAASDSEYVFYLTAQELDDLNQELLALLRPRVLERLTDPSQRPPGSVPVEMLIFSYPMELPPAEGDDQPGPGRES
ncbi:MAG TPA: helix-turn-helix domain-containing protein [Streptosporangiaceae bacterium]|jgi:DNA-binding transcriptional ArsR family regulator